MPPRQRPDQGKPPGWSLEQVPALDRGVVVLASGEFDIASVSDVRRVIASAAKSQPRPARVVIDLSRVTFLDAAMLNTLVGERRRLVGVGGDLVLVGVTTWSMRIIEICGLRQTLGL
ncbi:MAG: anti-sigma factor antagonist [Mycobacterium sp.]|nr:anti-sigma factor antagonist [Mycobacterium sp.]